MVLTLAVVFALGMRHGVDADHLAAIDGFSRLRPSRWNGVLFGLGHGLVVSVLAVLVGRLAGEVDLGWLSPYLFLGVAGLNLWRLLKPGHSVLHAHAGRKAALAASPFLMGLLLAMGMETSTQLSALALAQSVPPLLLGVAFTLGMILTDGIDGLFAAALQRGQHADPGRAALASRVMGWMVVALSAGFAAAGFLDLDTEHVAGPLGVGTFIALIALRLWSRMGRAPVAPA
ncbi:nickel transporter [Deinococcus fonticola]|uniref:HoxN/HupN/NixA family nickel/cobalt transporter n=1 Tax=Deinococcus fonticola TaxID=2528713 RepID=UPI0010754ED1|nr:nickel transporter [Deinococcus fonticola]